MMRQWINLFEAKLTPAQRYIEKIEDRSEFYVRLDLSPEDEYDVAINRIYVEPHERGEGIASRALTLMARLADRMNITLFLEALPDEADEDMTMDVHTLAKFYTRFGFVGDQVREGGIMMHRSPKGQR